MTQYGAILALKKCLKRLALIDESPAKSGIPAL